MSMVIYGPRACGKTRNATKLAAFYNCTSIVDDDVVTYPKTTKEWVKFKGGRTLYLTSELPPEEALESRRVISYADAAKEAGIKT